jgi:hypothetical protein
MGGRRGARSMMIASVGVLGVALAGCGGGASSSPRSSSASTSTTTTTAAQRPVRDSEPYAQARGDVCGRGRRAIAAHLGVRAGSLATRRTSANTDAPECVFTARAHGTRIVLSVSVSGAPQPYAVLDRAAVEQSQLWGASRFTAAPQLVTHLGLPAQEHVMTTDAVNLITATIMHWPGSHERDRRRLAVAAARPYLGPLRPKLARGPAPVGG